MLRLRKTSGGQQAIAAARERGIAASRIGYTQFPWNIHPDDQYIRVVPNGPFTQSWQGVQKTTLITQVGTKRASLYSPVPIFMRQLSPQTSRILMNNLASTASGAGPATLQAMTDEYQETGNAVSFKSMVLRKLLGKS